MSTSSGATRGARRDARPIGQSSPDLLAAAADHSLIGRDGGYLKVMPYTGEVLPADPEEFAKTGPYVSPAPIKPRSARPRQMPAQPPFPDEVERTDPIACSPSRVRFTYRMRSPVPAVPGSDRMARSCWNSLGKCRTGAQSADLMLALRMANRHGLIAGATGTGKTISLQVLAGGFAKAGRTGLPGGRQRRSLPASARWAATARRQKSAPRRWDLNDWQGIRFPVVYWGSVRPAGPPDPHHDFRKWGRCCANLLELNDVQEGALNIAFRLADEQGLLLLDLKDLRAMLSYVADNATEISGKYGNVAKPRWAPFSASCWCWKTRAATGSSGEPAGSQRFDAGRARAMPSSTCWPPTS